MAKFEQGEVVYWIGGGIREIVRKVVVSRVTATLAFIEVDGREQKFDRASGGQRPRPSGYDRGSHIDHVSDAGDARYREFSRREAARNLARAAERFERGDEAQAAAIEKHYATWKELGDVQS